MSMLGKLTFLVLGVHAPHLRGIRKEALGA
jgi:hypothetical protein